MSRGLSSGIAIRNRILTMRVPLIRQFVAASFVAVSVLTVMSSPGISAALQGRSTVRITARIVHGIRVPVGIARQGSHVWIVSNGSNSVVELNASNGATVRRVSGAAYGFKYPNAIVAAGNDLWIVNLSLIHI